MLEGLGDLRDFVETVNNLPDDYTGTMHVVLNSLNFYSAGRTLLSLFLLLSVENKKEAAESALHILYSASLTSEMSRLVTAATTRLLKATRSTSSIRASSGNSNISANYDATTVADISKQLGSKFNQKAAVAERRRVMLDEAHSNVRDRYMHPLKPAHRLGYLKYRTQGMLLPFSFQDMHFAEPNR